MWRLRGLAQDRPLLLGKTRYSGRNVQPKSSEDLLRGPASYDCIAVVWHGLAQTARLVDVLAGIDVELAFLGTALVFDVGADPPGVVISDIWSLSSGRGSFRFPGRDSRLASGTRIGKHHMRHRCAMESSYTL